MRNTNFALDLGSVMVSSQDRHYVFVQNGQLQRKVILRVADLMRLATRALYYLHGQVAVDKAMMVLAESKGNALGDGIDVAALRKGHLHGTYIEDSFVQYMDGVILQYRADVGDYIEESCRSWFVPAQRVYFSHLVLSPTANQPRSACISFDECYTLESLVKPDEPLRLCQAELFGMAVVIYSDLIRPVLNFVLEYRRGNTSPVAAVIPRAEDLSIDVLREALKEVENPDSDSIFEEVLLQVFVALDETFAGMGEDLNAGIAARWAELTRREEQISQREAAVRSRQVDLETEIQQRLEAEKRTLQRKAKEFEHEKSKLQQDYAKLSQQREDLNAARVLLKEERTAFEEDLAAVSEIPVLKQKISELEGRNAGLLAKLREKRT